MEKEELVYNGMKFPVSLSNKITDEATERGIDRTSVVREAMKEHFKRKEHPEILVEQVKQAMRENPEAFAPLIKEEVRAQLRSELRQILGDKYQS